MERDGRDVECFLQHAVIQVVVSPFLAYVGTHANRVQHEIYRSAQDLHRTGENGLQVLDACRVSGNNLGVQFLCQGIHLAHTYGDRRITQRDGRTLLYGFLSHFPGDRHIVQRTEDNAFLAFQ